MIEGGRKKRMMNFRILLVLAAAVALQFGTASVALGDTVVLTYTGNNFTTFVDSPSPDGHFDNTMFLSARILLPNELGPNFSGGIDAHHTEFTLFSGNNVFLSNSFNPFSGGFGLGGLPLEMYFRTNANGDIVAWRIWYAGPYGCGSDCGIATCNDALGPPNIPFSCSNTIGDGVTAHSAFPSGYDSAFVANNPGQWTAQVPELNSAALLAMGLAGIAWRYRKSLRSLASRRHS